MVNTETNANKKIPVSAKIPKDIKEKVMEIALKEERSLSQVLTRLLSTHPLLQSGKEAETALAK